MAGHGTESQPIVAGVAGRYASALFDLTRERGSMDGVAIELERFEALIRESPDLQRLLRSPVFSAEQQSAAVGAILDRAGIGGLAANFIRLVASKRRLFALRDMIRGYRALVSQAKGIVPAQVTLADQPSSQVIEEIKDALRGVAGSDVDLDVKIDPSLIGGLVVRIGSRMVDASLRTKLNSIRLAMREVR